MNPIANPGPNSLPPNLDQLARALNAPERWKALAELAKGEALPVIELARRQRISPGNMSRHMRLLRETGFVSIGYGKLYSLAPALKLDPQSRTLDLGLCTLKLDGIAGDR